MPQHGTSAVRGVPDSCGTNRDATRHAYKRRSDSETVKYADGERSDEAPATPGKTRQRQEWDTPGVIVITVKHSIISIFLPQAE